MKARCISKKVKIRTCKTVIKPVIVCGGETWALFEQATSTLATWEGRRLRKICGPICVRGVWCIRTDEELNLYQDIDTETGINLRRLKWLSHLIRMENNRILKIVLDSKLD